MNHDDLKKLLALKDESETDGVRLKWDDLDGLVTEFEKARDAMGTDFPKDGKIAKAHQENLDTVYKAAKYGHLAALEVHVRGTGKVMAALVALNIEENGDADIVPLALFFNGNPYELIDPPKPGPRSRQRLRQVSDRVS